MPLKQWFCMKCQVRVNSPFDIRRNGGLKHYSVFLHVFSWSVQEWAAGRTPGLQAMGGGSFLGNKEVK